MPKIHTQSLYGQQAWITRKNRNPLIETGGNWPPAVNYFSDCKPFARTPCRPFHLVALSGEPPLTNSWNPGVSHL